MTDTTATQPMPPIARRVPTQRTHHGDVFVDDYEWLRDKSNPDVIAHLNAENAYTDAVLAAQEPLRERLFDEKHPGITEVHLKLSRPGRTLTVKLDDSLRVNATPALFGDLKALLGPSCLG